MPGPPPLPTPGTAVKRINLRDLRANPRGPAPALAIRKASDRPPKADGQKNDRDLGDALVLAKRHEERAVLAEAERDEARIEAQAARNELATLQKKVARLEAELAVVRAGDVKSDPRKSNADLQKHVGAMVQGIVELRNALIQAATDLETLHERELETAALRDRILTSAASLLVKAAGQAQPVDPPAREPAPVRPPTESSPLTFAKPAAALILPPDSGNARPPTSSSADIPVTVDISEVQELIESLLPPPPAKE